MTSIFLVVLFVIFIRDSLQSDPLSQVTWSGKIVGGRTATLGQFPYQVSLQRSRDTSTKHVCGGAIYNSRWIITAGHCILYFNGTDEAKVVVGTVDLERITNVYDVEKLIIHPDFDKVLKKNDIGLIKTQISIEFNENVQPIDINHEFISPNIENAITSGWGRITIQGGRTSLLQYLNVSIIDNESCRQAHRISKRSVFIYDNVLCTQGQKMTGTCNGDSGGPLVSNSTLIGIVSWGIRCAIGLPDVYTRVSSHTKWIEENTGERR